jgi:membrane protein YqaA with SNARE-associated domain
MNFEVLVGEVGVAAASLIVGVVSGLFPLINTELYLLIVSPLASSAALPAIAILSALGQMLSKTIVFLAGRGVIEIQMRRLSAKLVQASVYLDRHRRRVGFFMFFSAVVGLPPFYVVSFAAGGLRVQFVTFFATGLLGRTIRFGIIVYFPQLVFQLL